MGGRYTNGKRWKGCYIYILKKKKKKKTASIPNKQAGNIEFSSP